MSLLISEGKEYDTFLFKGAIRGRRNVYSVHYQAAMTMPELFSVLHCVPNDMSGAISRLLNNLPALTLM